ncbi:MAG: SusC/RagA family TonB-linked outer membrane protein [Chlorobi bacterium]|nr:SusC/RagA family TonB-linked outer membrane protein [Chlorobiota bacterium]
MKKFSMLIFLFVFIGMQIVNAQKREITGVVTSAEDGSTLPGVSVVVKGTTIGTSTDINGKYAIEVSEDVTSLVFTFVGMKVKEAPLGASNVLNVQLEPEVIGVDEVVVTALGISREKKSLGYAVQEVSGDEIDRTKNTNVINSISGKVSGVQVKTSTNMGGSSNIVIRGSSSLTGDNQVLFVVDGIPINNQNTNNVNQRRGRSGYDYGNPISDINPNDIESMNVLKGAAATALYGSRASNGVIIITTKKGKKSTNGQKSLKVDLSHSTMFHVLDKSTFPEYQKEYGQGYGPYYSGRFYGDGSEYEGLYYYDYDGDGTLDYVEPTTEDASMGSKFDPNLMIYNWASFYPESPTYNQKVPYVAGANDPSYFFQRARTLTSSIDISGGSDVATFRLGYTNTDETGMMPNSELKRNNITFNGSFDVMDNLTVSASAMYTHNYTKGRNHTGYSDNILSSFRQWYNIGVDMKLQEDYYMLNHNNVTWNPNSENNLRPIYWDNPYWQRYENYQSDERDRLIGYTQLDWKINDNFDFMTRASVDYYGFLQEERKAVGSVAGSFGVGRPDVQSGYARNEYTFIETNFDAMLKFNKYITDDISLNGLLGSNIRLTRLDNVYASTNGGLAVPGTYALSNSASPMLPPEESYEETGVNGFFGSISVGIKNMIFIDATARNDVSSTLPPGNWSYFYPGVSTSFLFTDLVDQSWLNLGKIRLNYAKVGNDAPWGRVKDSYTIVSPFGGNTLVRFPSYKNNPELRPELSTSIEGGLQLAMFENRVGFDIALYKTNTIDQVVPLAVSRVTGYSSKYVNIGEVENKGIEVVLNVSPVNTPDFRWDITWNFAKNINKVISLGGDIENLQLASLQGGVTINAREGEPYGAIQGTDFVYSPDGRKIIKSNGYYEKTGTSDQVIGNIQPDWNSGITNTISYKGFSASFLIDMQMGGSIFSLDQWYGMGTGLYVETAGTNDLGNPVRDQIYDASGNVLLSYIDLPGYDPADGYDPKSGGMVLDGVVGTDVDGDGEWTSADTYEENIRRVAGNDYRVWGWSRNPNAKFVYDATYVKLREVSIGYSIPKSFLEKAFISNATISFIGSNLWILYKDLPHADPEASQGAGNIQGWQSGVFPTARNFGFNINLQF